MLANSICMYVLFAMAYAVHRLRGDLRGRKLLLLACDEEACESLTRDAATFSAALILVYSLWTLIFGPMGRAGAISGQYH